MKASTATSLVDQYRPPVRRAVESAGPCLAEGCDGTLEVRHERQFGRVYTVCPVCERRVGELQQLRRVVAQLTEQRDHFKALLARTEAERKAAVDALTPVQRERSARQARINERDAEVERRYVAGESGEAIAKALGLTGSGVLAILKRRGVERRPRATRTTRTASPRLPGSPRSYRPKACARCSSTFAPSGPRSKYCERCPSGAPS